jgi:hypothetical protein
MTREEWRDWAILGRIVERVEGQKRFCGDTLLQKSAYFPQGDIRGADLTPFRIYYYGPFSFDLRETLSTMEGLVVQTVPHEWEATYRIGRRYGQVRDRFAKTMQRLEPAIDWVMRELAPLGVKELEPLATGLFLKQEQPHATDETLATRLHVIKPHVSVDAARFALQKVGGWMAERP